MTGAACLLAAFAAESQAAGELVAKDWDAGVKAGQIQAFDLTDEVYGGVGPYTYALIGSSGEETLVFENRYLRLTLDSKEAGRGSRIGREAAGDDTISYVEYKVTDAVGDTATGTITVRGIDDPYPFEWDSIREGQSGNVGHPFEAFVAGYQGGWHPAHTASSSDLPNGLTFIHHASWNQGNIRIEGIPEEAGTFPITVTATDDHGQVLTHLFNIVIAAAPQIADLPDGKINVTYPTQTLAAEGVTGPYTYTVTGLPAGLTFDGTDKISGTPTVSGPFEVTIVIKDKDGYETTKTQTLTITAAPTHELTNLPDGKINILYPTQTLAATGGTGPYEYTVSGLPAGLTFDGTDKISGTPTVSGPFEVTIVIKDKDGYETTKTQTLVIAAAPVIEIGPEVLPAGQVGLDYGSQQLTASGGTAAYTFTADTIPRGLLLSDGVISGKPQEAGRFGIWITAKDADGYEAQKHYMLQIADAPTITIDLTSLPDGKVDLDYGSHLLVANGGTEPYTYEVSGLPDGLTFDGKDKISGIPTKAGYFTIDVKITDGQGYTVTKGQSIEIAAAPVMELADLPDGKINCRATINVGTASIKMSLSR